MKLEAERDRPGARAGVRPIRQTLPEVKNKYRKYVEEYKIIEIHIYLAGKKTDYNRFGSPKIPK